MEILSIVVAIVFAIILFFWLTYNRLVTLKLRVDEAWSQIDVQLKRRVDLIPNLVETVKGYAKHEKEVFENVTKARSEMLSAQSKDDKAQADNMLSGALKSLFAIAEAYPELKASENFKHLQEEVSDTEDKIAYSRQFYNNVVMDFNTALKTFPTVLVANQLGFKEAEFFGKDLKDSDKEPVKVSF